VSGFLKKIWNYTNAFGYLLNEWDKWDGPNDEKGQYSDKGSDQGNHFPISYSIQRVAPNGWDELEEGWQ